MAEEQKYYSIVTDTGNAKIMKALTENHKINITEFAVGDGAGSYYKPETSQTGLKNEFWRGEINSCEINAESENILEIKAIVPGDVGGFIIREMGVFDSEGTLIAICNTPDSPKVKIIDGIVHEMNLIMEIVLMNRDVVQLIVDPHVITATKADVEKAVEEIKSIKEPEIEEQADRENIENGDTLGVILGKIKKWLEWLSDLGTAAFAKIANDCTTTEDGSVLDARQGKVLQDQVDTLKKSVADGKTAVAAAISAKGVSTAADASYATMAANIGNISSASTITFTINIGATCTGHEGTRYQNRRETYQINVKNRTISKVSSVITDQFSKTDAAASSSAGSITSVT